MKRVMTAAAVSVLIAASARGDVVGWRQNWTGSFPEAKAPTTWGRTFSNSVVKGLKLGLAKPAGDAPGDAKPMGDGLLLGGLVLGPFAPNDPAKALDEAFLNDEGNLQPSPGDKSGELEWKPLTQDRPAYQHSDVAPLPIYRLLGRSKNGAVAYVVSYVWSDRGGKVALMLDHTGGCKAWLNGKEFHSNPKPSIGFGWWHWLSRIKITFAPQPSSQRYELDLKQGWNRLVFKVSSTEWEWGSGWAVLPRFEDVVTPKYEDKNILWVAPLPDTSNANPIVVGDKIFVVSEQDELLCLRKSDGKLLWRRINSYYEATPKAERDKYPLIKEQVDPLMEQLARETDNVHRRELQAQIKTLLSKADEKKFGMIMEDHPLSHYYATGFTTPTPCSDGKAVYVWFTQGVAASYDLDGKRRWIRRMDEMVKSPDDVYGPYFYPQGCVLADGKFILSEKDTFALDAATGEIAWRQPKFGLGMGAMPVVVDGTTAVMGYGGAARVSDGKVLWAGPKQPMPFGSGGGTWADGRFCMPFAGGIGYHVYDFSEAKGDEWKPLARSGGASAPEENKWKGDDFFKAGAWRDIFLFSAPLAHDGLVYIVASDGMLYVMDEITARLVYRRKLPLEPLETVRAVGLCAPVTLGGKNVYVLDNQGNCVVFEPGREYKQVALNRIETFVPRNHTGDGWKEVGPHAAPVFDGNRLYVRSEANLYCIGGK